MNKMKLIVIALIALLIIAGVGFYYVSTHRENVDFKEGLVAPKGITMIDQPDRPLIPGSKLREDEIEIFDEIVLNTLMMQINKASLEQAAKQDIAGIAAKDRVLSIGTIYPEEAAKSNRLSRIEILADGTFIVSKTMNGRQQYAKGKFDSYTMDYLVALYALNKV